MEKAKDEEYYLLIPNPITDNEEEFDLDRESNVGLAMRLIRKREKIMDSMRSDFQKLEDLRSKHNVDQIEKETQNLINKISKISEDDFDSEDEYDEKFRELEKELKSIKDDYPQEVIDLQNKTGEQMEEADRLGVKICAVVLNPVDGTPEEYNSKKDYIEELIGSDQDIQQIISFFLSTLNSTMKSLKGVGIQMKKRSNGKKKD